MSKIVVQLYTKGPYNMAMHFMERGREASDASTPSRPGNHNKPSSPVKSAMKSSPAKSARSPVIKSAASPATEVLTSPAKARGTGSNSPATGKLVPAGSPDKSVTIPPEYVNDEDDDSSYHSGEPGDYVSESDVEETDINEILRKRTEGNSMKLEGNVGALSQLYTVDERKRTDLYRPRRSVLWTLMYLALGIGGPVLACLAMLSKLVCVLLMLFSTVFAPLWMMA